MERKQQIHPYSREKTANPSIQWRVNCQSISAVKRKLRIHPHIGEETANPSLQWSGNSNSFPGNIESIHAVERKQLIHPWKQRIHPCDGKEAS
jgi:hypothetical protein